MSGIFPRRMAAAAAVLFLVAGLVAAGEILSTMRNVNAVPEAHGFQVIPATDVTVAPLPVDHSPGQAFEIIRPDGRPVTIGRLFTSCTCIQLQAHKRTFAAGERAILQLRNIRPTPPAGAVYAIFVQITSPVRTTLRFDTFVQSLSPEAAAAPATLASGDQPASDPAAPASPAPAATAAAATVPATPPPTGVNTDLAAQIHRQLEAVEAEIQEERQATAGIVTLEDGTQAPELAGELRDELEAMLDRELAVRRVDAASGNQGDTGAELRELGTADLAVDLEDGLPDFYAAAPAPATAPVISGDAAPVLAGDSLRPPSPEAAIVPAVTADAATATAPGPEPEAAAPAVADAAPEAIQPEAAPIAAAASQALAMPATAPETPAPATAPSPEPDMGVAIPRPPERDPNARKPVQAVSLITVGVRDMAASIRFYEALGWRQAARGKYDQTAFFQLQGQILALYPMADLLREQNMVGRTPAPGGITLALHVQDKADVWSVYQRFIDAGGLSLRPPAEMASGAVSSYVADPDGNAWEISWVPQFRIDEDGGLWLP